MSMLRVLSMATLLVSGCSSISAGLHVQDAWARPAGEGMNSAAYFTIENKAGEDVLTGVRSNIAEHTEIHRSFKGSDGVMRMERQPSVKVPPWNRITFEPGGLHVMFVSLNQDLDEGAEIELHLQFVKQGELVINVPIQSR